MQTNFLRHPPHWGCPHTVVGAIITLYTSMLSQMYEQNNMAFFRYLQNCKVTFSLRFTIITIFGEAIAHILFVQCYCYPRTGNNRNCVHPWQKERESKSESLIRNLLLISFCKLIWFDLIPICQAAAAVWLLFLWTQNPFQH